VIRLSGNWGYDYFGQTVLVNKHLHLTEEFPSNVYPILHNWLFQLSDPIREQVDDYKRKNFGSYNVGIQIRYPISKTTEGVFYKGQKDHEGVPVPPLSLFAETAYQLSYQQTKSNFEDVRWLVATQEPKLIEELKKKHGNERIIFYEGKIITTFDRDTKGQLSSFITWWLLGECDDVITTECSTYGTTAAVRRGIIPVVCTHGRFCFRKLSAHPCQQTPARDDDEYHVHAHFCLKDELQEFLSVESSCAYFGSVVRNNPNFQQGKNW